MEIGKYKLVKIVDIALSIDVLAQYIYMCRSDRRETCIRFLPFTHVAEGSHNASHPSTSQGKNVGNILKIMKKTKPNSK